MPTKLAYATDTTSAFGGIIAFNREVDGETVKQITDNQFMEVLMAPKFTAEALEIAAAKKNVRVFCDVPDEQQIVPFLLGRLAFGDDFQIGAADAVDVGRLYQQSAADAFKFEAVRACFQRHFQHAHVFLGGGDFEGFSGELRCHQDFHKLVVGNLFHGCAGPLRG